MVTLQELIGKIQEFASEISAQSLCQASYQPEKEARPSCCFQNVLDKVAKDNGNIIFGWTFIYRINPEYGGYLIATHHAVWCAPDSTLIDVTPFTNDPKHHPIAPNNNVIFLVDESAQPVVNGVILAPLALKFFPLSDSPDLKTYLVRLLEDEQKACQEIYSGNIDPAQVSGIWNN